VALWSAGGTIENVPTDPRYRCADVDRDQTVEQLREHFVVGRLTPEEFDERTDAAYAAKTFGDLTALVEDLPAPPEPEPPAPIEPRGAEARRQLAVWSGWMSTSMVCLTIWGLMSLVIGHVMPFWPVFVIGPWGAVLVARTITGTHRPTNGRPGRYDDWPDNWR